ncbi:MAG: hypothetical protein ACI4DW_10525 [Lachnospiraceae bacterium]
MVIAVSLACVTILVGLSACGKNASDAGENTVSDEESAIQAEVSETSIQDVGDNGETIMDMEDEITENAEEKNVEKEVVPIWYMDAEGFHNDEWGVVIRKDTSIYSCSQKFLHESIYYKNRDNICELSGWSCGYYEADMDTYLSEHPGMQKGEYEGITYAFGKTSEIGDDTVVLIGNGIILSAVSGRSGEELDTDKINRFLSESGVLQPYVGVTEDECLAFLAEDGLYCPALGIKISCNEDTNDLYSGQIELLEFIYQSWTDNYFIDLITIRIRDESIQCGITYATDTDCAQEVVDNFVEWRSGYSAIDGTDQVEIGKLNFLGRGRVRTQGTEFEIGEEDWLLYSDQSEWSITFEDIDAGDSYQNYFWIFENQTGER